MSCYLYIGVMCSNVVTLFKYQAVNHPLSRGNLFLEFTLSKSSVHSLIENLLQQRWLFKENRLVFPMEQWFVLYLITLIGAVRGGWVGFLDGMRLDHASLSRKGKIASPSTIRIYVVSLLASTRSKMIDQRVCLPKWNTSEYLASFLGICLWVPFFRLPATCYVQKTQSSMPLLWRASSPVLWDSASSMSRYSFCLLRVITHGFDGGEVLETDFGIFVSLFYCLCAASVCDLEMSNDIFSFLDFPTLISRACCIA